MPRGRRPGPNREAFGLTGSHCHAIETRPRPSPGRRVSATRIELRHSSATKHLPPFPVTALSASDSDCGSPSVRYHQTVMVRTSAIDWVAMLSSMLIATSGCSKPNRDIYRDESTRRIASACGLYRDAVVIDPRYGERVMTVSQTIQRGSPRWRCLETGAQQMGYRLEYSLILD